jgi:hypothetical protein
MSVYPYEPKRFKEVCEAIRARIGEAKATQQIEAASLCYLTGSVCALLENLGLAAVSTCLNLQVSKTLTVDGHSLGELEPIIRALQADAEDALKELRNGN